MRKSLLVSAIALGVYILSVGYSQGTATVGGQNRSGSYGSQPSCGDSSLNCHSPNDANMVVDIELRDMGGNLVNNSRYMPNGFYWVIISGSASGNLPKYGYQFSVQAQSGSGGSYLPTATRQTAVVGQAVIMEPQNPFNTNSSVGINNNYKDSFLWQAPPASSGQLTLHASALLANDNGSKSGDKTNHYQRSVFPVPAGVNDFDESVQIRVYPNPVQDFLNVQVEATTVGTYTVTVYGMQGATLVKEKMEAGANGYSKRLDLTSLPSGAYFLEIREGEKAKVISLIRR